jgi:hypothetical protein
MILFCNHRQPIQKLGSVIVFRYVFTICYDMNAILEERFIIKFDLLHYKVYNSIFGAFFYIET